MASSKQTNWLVGACVALAAVLTSQLALAAPPRLGDDVPGAFPDQPNAVSFGWDHESIQLEGPLATSDVTHDYFRLRYAFNPKTAVSFRYGTHELGGAVGLSSPIFDDKDNAESYELDLALNLHNIAATPANPDNNVEFAAGSAFTMGVSGTQYQSDIGELTEDQSLLKAYLLYTTDLSPEMRAHTVFSSARLSGDGYSGSVNRVGAGLDYTLIDGRRPLVLLVNGIIDVYNFREPEFNTSRMSRFDVGLRYNVAEDWFASVGYVTVNDSENDASSSGVFAGLQYVDMPSPPCEPCEEVEEAPEAAPAAEDTQAAAPEETVVAQAETPAAEDNGEAVPADDEGETEAVLLAAVPDEAAGAEEALAEAADDADGVLIPPFPVVLPRHTSASAVMVRAGVDVHSPQPNHTAPEAEMVRPEPPEPVVAPSPDLATMVAESLARMEAEDTAASEPAGDAPAADDAPAGDTPGLVEVDEAPALLTTDTSAVGREQDSGD
jgi:hypothetical protein